MQPTLVLQPAKISHLPEHLIFIIMSYLSGTDLVYFCAISLSRLIFSEQYELICKLPCQTLPLILPPRKIFVMSLLNEEMTDQLAMICWCEKNGIKSKNVLVSEIKGLESFLSSDKIISNDVELISTVVRRCQCSIVNNESVPGMLRHLLSFRFFNSATIEDCAYLGAQNFALMSFIADYSDNQLCGAYSGLEFALEMFEMSSDEKTSDEYKKKINEAYTKTLKFYTYLSDENTLLYRWKTGKNAPAKITMGIRDCLMYAKESINKADEFYRQQSIPIETARDTPAKSSISAFSHTHYSPPSPIKGEDLLYSRYKPSKSNCIIC